MIRPNAVGGLLLFLLVAGCGGGGDVTERTFQPEGDKTVNVKDQIKDIKTDIHFGYSMVYALENHIMVVEVLKGNGKSMHLYDKNTFAHAASTGIIGEGPGEIMRPGHVGMDEESRVFWVPDHGKEVMLRFRLDSVLADEGYKPEKAFRLDHDFFMIRFGFPNDSTALGKAVHPTSSSSFEAMTARLNVRTRKLEKFGYEHPEAVERMSNSLFDLSLENKVYANAYPYCDLLTVCHLDGTLKHNLYGPDRFDNKDNRKSYFSGVDFFRGHIVASYIGDTGLVTDKFKQPRGNLPSKLLVFGPEGDLVRTLETGHKFTSFCADEENGRIIACFDDREEPLGYFDLKLD